MPPGCVWSAWMVDVGSDWYFIQADRLEILECFETTSRGIVSTRILSTESTRQKKISLASSRTAFTEFYWCPLRFEFGSSHKLVFITCKTESTQSSRLVQYLTKDLLPFKWFKLKTGSHYLFHKLVLFIHIHESFSFKLLHLLWEIMHFQVRCSVNTFLAVEDSFFKPECVLKLQTQ